MPQRTLKRPHRFLTAEEVRRLVAASNEPLRTIIVLATMTGLRIGEILALRWGRIDLLRGTLRVAGDCYNGHFGSPKTRASRREVPLAPAVVRELKNLYSRSAEHSPDASVFAKNQGLPFAADNLRKRHYEPRARDLVCNEPIGILSTHALHIVAFTGNSFEGCTGSAWALTYGDNFGDLYTRQWECTKRRCEPSRRAIVPKLESCRSIAEKESQLVQ
jgi:integrase